jgi:hypothetical protein
MTAFADYFLASLVSSGLVLAAFAWIFQAAASRLLDKRLASFRHQLQLEGTEHALALKSQIDFRERQLGEFYGPIYALLKRGKPIYRLWQQGRLDEIDASLRELFIDANNQIVDIVLTRAHLVDGATIPESFTRFLTHVAVWHGYLKTPHRGVPVGKDDFPEAYYPVGFDQEIFETTERLKRELYELHGRYGLLSSRST